MFVTIGSVCWPFGWQYKKGENGSLPVLYCDVPPKYQATIPLLGDGWWVSGARSLLFDGVISDTPCRIIEIEPERLKGRQPGSLIKGRGDTVLVIERCSEAEDQKILLINLSIENHSGRLGIFPRKGKEYKVTTWWCDSCYVPKCQDGVTREFVHMITSLDADNGHVCIGVAAGDDPDAHLDIFAWETKHYQNTRDDYVSWVARGAQFQQLGRRLPEERCLLLRRAEARAREDKPKLGQCFRDIDKLLKELKQPPLEWYDDIYFRTSLSKIWWPCTENGVLEVKDDLEQRLAKLSRTN